MSDEKKQPLMMDGTQTKAEYLVFARRGGFVLGVKPESVLDGKAFGHDGTTWFGARLRSAIGGTLLASLPSSTVVSIKDMMLTTATAWPEIIWDNTNETRSSVVIGVLLEGKPLGTDEEVQKFLDEVDNGKLAQNMADYLAMLAGEEHLIMPVGDIRDWLDTYYKNLVKQIMDALGKQKAIKEEMKAQLGQFGMQAQILKKALEKAQELAMANTAEDKEPPAEGA